MSDATTVLSAELSANPQKLIEGFSRADQATGAWAVAAQRHMATAQASFNGVDFAVVTSKAKAEQIKLIELQHQLDVARAAGESATIVKLTEEIALLQKIRQLRSAGFNDTDARSAASSSIAAVARAREEAELREAAAKRRERTIGDPGQALAGVFARTRLGVLEEGGAKIPLFGSALEELGVAGLGAAAGLAAVAVAGEEVKKSLEYADDIDRTSKALGISTTQLQEYDYAFAGTSVGIAKGREALASFNEVFGKYSSGLASGKTAKFLDALGFTPETARQLGTTEEALEKTLTALAKIQNPQQRAALATQLGLKDFLVVLAEGQEGVERFFKTTREAQAAGAVISPDEIKRGGELNDKLEQIEHTVSVELKKAFIELGPAVLYIAGLVEKIAGGIARTVQEFRGITHFDRGTVDAKYREESDYQSALYNSGLAGKVDPKTGRASGGVLSFAFNNKADNLAALNARRADLDKLDKETLPTGQGGADFSKAPKEKRAAPDQTASYDKAAVDAYQSSLKALNTALAALTGDIEARAEFEKQAVDADLAKKLADLDKQEADIRKAKVDAHQADQLLLIGLARSDEQIAALARKELIDRNALAALRDQELQRAREDAGYEARIRTARAAVKPDAQGRADASLQNFADQQALEDQAQQNDLAKRVADKKLSQDEADKTLADGRAARGAERVAQRDSTLRGSDPLYALGHPLTSINDDLKGAEADGVKALGDGLAAVVAGTKSVKEAFSDMAQSIISDLIKIAVQREIEAPLANFLFGAQGGGNVAATGGTGVVGSIIGGLLTGKFAGGTDSAPGGLSLVGERGPELVNLARGAQVVPNDILRSIGGMGVPQRGGGGVTAVINIDAGGAFSLDHVHDAVAAGVSQAVAASGLQLAGVTRRQSQSARNDLSRY